MHLPQSKAKVGSKELIAMTTVLVTTQSFLDYPRIVSENAMEAAWMEPVVAGVLTILAVLVVDVLFRKVSPDYGLAEVARYAFGKLGTAVIGFLFALYFLITAANTMRLFMENVVSTVLPHTPIVIVGAIFVASVAYVAYTGLEGIARIGFVAFPILFTGIIALSLLTANHWKPALLYPFLGTGPLHVVLTGLGSSAIFLNFTVLCTIRAHFHRPQDFRVVGIKSTLWSVVLLVVFLLAYHMVFSPSEATKLTSPMYSMARVIQLGRFVQRLESIFIFMWVSAAVVKIAIMLWTTAYFLASAFNWPTYRPILPALSLLALSASLIPPDVAFITRFNDNVLWRWGWVFVFALPMIVLVLARFHRPGRRSVRT